MSLVELSLLPKTFAAVDASLLISVIYFREKVDLTALPLGSTKKATDLE
jgi:hypothetical protein